MAQKKWSRVPSLVLGERRAEENEDILCGEWTEQTDWVSSTQRAPSAVSSGDSFHCADMCGESSMLGTRQAAVSYRDDGLNMIEWMGGGGRDCGNNVSRLLQTPPNFFYFCIGCFVISPELFLLQSAIILRSSSASDNFIEHTFFTMFSPFYSEISAQTASCGLWEYHIIG